MSAEECYRILGVPSGANPQEIKRAYRHQAKALHPDVNTSLDASHQFVAVSQAYRLLTTEPTEYSLARLAAPHIRIHPQDPYHPETRQERVARHARMQYEEFMRNNDKFKKSAWYMPVKVFTYAVWLMGAFVAAGFTVTPLFIVVTNQANGLSTLPMALMGLATMTGVYRFRMEFQRYF